MGPGATVNDFPYQSPIDMVGPSQSLEGLSRIGRPDSENLGFVQLGSYMLTAPYSTSVYEHVGTVFFVGAPLEVFQPIVRWVTIREVAAFHTFRARADECLQDEGMNMAGESAAGFPQGYDEVSGPVGFRFQGMPV